MNAKYKQAWVDALRSGNYQQGFGCLRNVNEQFCCLGVACDLVDNSAWEATENFWYSYLSGNEYQSAELSEALRRELGITSDTEAQLISLNDDTRWNFEKIADWIEKHLF